MAMTIISKLLLLTSFCLCFWLNAEPLVIGIRGNEEMVAKFAEKNGAEVLASETVEFPNGNTFVRLKGEVTHRDVVIILPKELSSDQLMELLIKARTAKTEGARMIAVKSPTLLKNVKLVDVKSPDPDFLQALLSEAGVDRVKETNRASRSSLTRPAKSDSFGAEGNAVITSQGEIKLAKELAKKTGYKYIEPNKKIPAQSAIYFVSQTSTPVNKNFFNMLSQIQQYKKKGHSVHLITPYLPYARTDKKDQVGVTITGRLVADLIESAGTTSATFVRAHAPQSQGFFSIPTFQLTSRPTITDYLSKLGVDIVIAPDAGAQKETTLFADMLERPVGVANKQRDPITGQAKLLDVSGPSVEGKKVVIIDDETASGGTLGKVGSLLTSLGASEVYAVVTHLAGTAKDAIESPALKEIIVTDTITPGQEHPKVKVLSMVNELAEHINRIEKHRRPNAHALCSEISKILGNY